MPRDIETEWAEKEANYFAMCLLMPEPMIRKDFEKHYKKTATGDLVKLLAKKYEVEEFVVTLRLVDLKLLSVI